MTKEKIIEVNPGDTLIINVKSDDNYFKNNYSISEFAKIANVSRSTINLKIKNGVIPKIYIGKSPRIEHKYLTNLKK